MRSNWHTCRVRNGSEYAASELRASRRAECSSAQKKEHALDTQLRWVSPFQVQAHPTWFHPTWFHPAEASAAAAAVVAAALVTVTAVVATSVLERLPTSSTHDPHKRRPRTSQRAGLPPLGRPCCSRREGSRCATGVTYCGWDPRTCRTAAWG